jgi:hypothetical protein
MFDVFIQMPHLYVNAFSVLTSNSLSFLIIKFEALVFKIRKNRERNHGLQFW